MKSVSDLGEHAEPTPILLYLVGTGHSGSTLVAFVLNTHPDILAIGIMSAPTLPEDQPSERMCSCGSRMGECPFFRKMADRLERHGLSFDPVHWNLLYRMSESSILSRVKTGSLRNTTLEELRDVLWSFHPGYRRERELLDRSNVLFVRSALSISGAKIFFDASKDPNRIRFLKRLEGVRLKVIHLVRDPRGLAYSRIRDKGMTADRAADAWVRTNRNANRHLASLDRGDWIRVRYEDFCTKTEEVLQQIGGFLGIGPIQRPTDFRKTPHHIMGNKMRLPENATSGIRLDEQWRERLSKADVERVVRRARSLAREYGYELGE